MVWRRRGLPGIHSVCIDSRDAQRVTVGVSCGGVLTSPDGGDSWETRCKGMVAEYMPPEQAENPCRIHTSWCCARRSRTRCGRSTTT